MRLFIGLLLAAAPQAFGQLAGQVPAPVHWTGQPSQGGLLIGTLDPGVTALILRVPGQADVAATIADGRFMLGFDRDAPPVATLIVAMADGRTQTIPLAVAPRAWRIERVDAPFHPPGFDARRPAELARIAAARAAVSPLTGWRERFGWPAIGPVRGIFGAQRLYRGAPGSFHNGVDIAAPAGAPVIAPASGRVVLAADAPFTLEGNLLILDHGGGLFSAFLHLSRIDVRAGELVAAGQRLGAVGMTGRATGPHLHWGLSWRDRKLDPLPTVAR